MCFTSSPCTAAGHHARTDRQRSTCIDACKLLQALSALFLRVSSAKRGPVVYPHAASRLHPSYLSVSLIVSFLRQPKPKEMSVASSLVSLSLILCMLCYEEKRNGKGFLDFSRLVILLQDFRPGVDPWRPLAPTLSSDSPSWPC